MDYLEPELYVPYTTCDELLLFHMAYTMGGTQSYQVNSCCFTWPTLWGEPRSTKLTLVVSNGLHYGGNPELPSELLLFHMAYTMGGTQSYQVNSCCFTWPTLWGEPRSTKLTLVVSNGLHYGENPELPSELLRVSHGLHYGENPELPSELFLLNTFYW